MDIIQELVKLIKINTRISSLHSSDEVLKEIMSEAMRLTSTVRAFILRVSEDGEVRCLSRFASSDAQLVVETGWSSSSALDAHAAQRIVYSTRALEEQEKAPSIVKGAIQTVISSPLSHEESTTIVLQLVGQDATRIDSQTLSLLNLLISQAQVTTTQKKLEAAALRNAALAATGELARQVAHDIRSPLAALDTATRDTSRLPKEERALIREAIGRIHEIADTLGMKHSDGRGVSSDHGATFPPEPLAALIESIVNEKRASLGPASRIRIEHSAAQDARAKVHAGEFKRLLSNLLNNAVEAVGAVGTVYIQLEADGERLVLKVKDDGRGIPEDVIHRLGQMGESHGKPEGSGLGLYHAKKHAAAWGGALSIRSAVGHGTEVVVSLPRTAESSSPSEKPPRGRTAVLLDDDALVHKTWQISARAKSVSLLAFKTSAELMRVLPSIPLDAEFFIDSELDGEAGTDVLNALFEKGFRNLYLATGLAADSFPPLVAAKAVVGKEPPWR